MADEELYQPSIGPPEDRKRPKAGTHAGPEAWAVPESILGPFNINPGYYGGAWAGVGAGGGGKLQQADIGEKPIGEYIESAAGVVQRPIGEAMPRYVAGAAMGGISEWMARVRGVPQLAGGIGFAESAMAMGRTGLVGTSTVTTEEAEGRASAWASFGPQRGVSAFGEPGMPEIQGKEGTMVVEFELDEWQRFAQQTDPSRIKFAAMHVLKEMGELLASTARALAPVDTGRLRNSIKVIISGAEQVSVVVDVPYAMAVEFGTAPHWPPIDAIAPWAERHGIAPGALAHSISLKGTRPHPFMGPAWESVAGMEEDIAYGAWDQVLGTEKLTLGAHVKTPTGPVEEIKEAVAQGEPDYKSMSQEDIMKLPQEERMKAMKAKFGGMKFG